MKMTFCGWRISTGGERKYGTVLLAFPAHSTHTITVQYDETELLEKIREQAPHFDTVFVCLYWKDFLLGRASSYEEAGFVCVSAGHIFDHNFVPRLRTLFELSDCTLSNRIGSYTGYSIFLGKPHLLIGQETFFSQTCTYDLQKELMDWYSDPGYVKAVKLFSENSTNVTQEHIDVLDPYIPTSGLVK